MHHRFVNAALILIISLFFLILFLWRPVERTYSQMEMPSQTETPTHTGTPTQTETPSQTETPTQTETPSHTETPSLTETPAQTGTPAASFFVPYIAAADLPSATPTATVRSPEEELVEGETLLRINTVRGAQGLPALVVADELTQSARRHSRYMADFYGANPDHEGPEGVYGCDRMLEAGYVWSTCNEIIGWGFGGNTSAMLNWWMNSEVHKNIILSSSYEDFGAGHVIEPASYWKTYWTVNFGTRKSGENELSAVYYKCTYRLEGPEGGISMMQYSKEPCLK